MSVTEAQRKNDCPAMHILFLSICCSRKIYFLSSIPQSSYICALLRPCDIFFSSFVACITTNFSTFAEFRPKMIEFSSKMKEFSLKLEKSILILLVSRIAKETPTASEVTWLSLLGRARELRNGDFLLYATY